VLSVGAALVHDLRVLPSCGVASDGPVGSVFLLHEEPFGEVRRVCPDPASVTSNLLARILVERAGSGVWAEDLSGTAQGRVLIGDAALALESWSGTDLGKAWKDWTGLPFVFAAWVIGPRVAERDWTEVDARLREAAERGMSRSGRERCVEAQTVVAPGRAREYLEGLRHRLDGRYREGMARYAREAARLGIGSGEVRWAC
jgi:predicted solute-binding protein